MTNQVNYQRRSNRLSQVVKQLAKHIQWIRTYSDSVNPFVGIDYDQVSVRMEFENMISIVDRCNALNWDTGGPAVENLTADGVIYKGTVFQRRLGPILTSELDSYAVGRRLVSNLDSAWIVGSSDVRHIQLLNASRTEMLDNVYDQAKSNREHSALIRRVQVSDSVYDQVEIVPLETIAVVFTTRITDSGELPMVTFECCGRRLCNTLRIFLNGTPVLREQTSASKQVSRAVCV